MPSLTLQRITIYPIKSLDGIELDQAQVLPGGALENDRRYALIDASGRFVHGKRTADIQRIRSRYDLANMEVELHDPRRRTTARFSLRDQAPAIGQWLSDAVGIECRLAENAATGHPDDTAAPGPTLISTATLREVAGWFPALSLDEARRRFRTNLEIGGTDEPFYEERFVPPAAGNPPTPFDIHGTRWLAAAICQRCVVPSRDSVTAAATPAFQKSFALERQRTLPAWAPADRFDHFYRLAINTRPAPGQSPGRIAVGDPIHWPA